MGDTGETGRPEVKDSRKIKGGDGRDGAACYKALYYVESSTETLWEYVKIIIIPSGSCMVHFINHSALN